jgi:hypothetical protein
VLPAVEVQDVADVSFFPQKHASLAAARQSASQPPAIPAIMNDIISIHVYYVCASERFRSFSNAPSGADYLFVSHSPESQARSPPCRPGQFFPLGRAARQERVGWIHVIRPLRHETLMAIQITLCTLPPTLATLSRRLFGTGKQTCLSIISAGSTLDLGYCYLY